MRLRHVRLADGALLWIVRNEGCRVTSVQYTTHQFLLVYQPLINLVDVEEEAVQV